MKTMNNQETPIFEMGRWLVYGAAAFQAYHMGRAFHVYDPSGWHFVGVNVGGLILGAVLNVIVARTATQLPAISATFSTLKELLPKASKKQDKKADQSRSRALKKMTLAAKQNIYTQFGFYILMAFSVLMIAPALYILWAETLPFSQSFIKVMAAVGAVIPDVAITVGGFAGSDAPASARGAGARSASDSPTKSDARPKKSVAPATDSAKSATDSSALRRTYPRRCEHCPSDSPNGLLKSANAVGGHMKKHHPELCKPKVLAVKLFGAEVMK
jgi:hypothetical protein